MAPGTLWPSSKQKLQAHLSVCPRLPTAQKTGHLYTNLGNYNLRVNPTHAMAPCASGNNDWIQQRVRIRPVSYTHLRAHETEADL
eukprot:2691630-Amphidinium_carterae.2